MPPLSPSKARPVGLGTSDDGQLVLTAGSHDLVLENARFAFRSVIRIGVRPGENTSYTVPLPSGAVRVETTEGAEIWVEGERAGLAPLGDVAVPIGTREIVVKHPALGERRQSVEVSAGATALVSLALADATADPAPAATPRLAPLSMPPPPRTP